MSRRDPLCLHVHAADERQPVAHFFLKPDNVVFLLGDLPRLKARMAATLCQAYYIILRFRFEEEKQTGAVPGGLFLDMASERNLCYNG